MRDSLISLYDASCRCAGLAQSCIRSYLTWSWSKDGWGAIQQGKTRAAKIDRESAQLGKAVHEWKSLPSLADALWHIQQANALRLTPLRIGREVYTTAHEAACELAIQVVSEWENVEGEAACWEQCEAFGLAIEPLARVDLVALIDMEHHTAINALGVATPKGTRQTGRPRKWGELEKLITEMPDSADETIANKFRQTYSQRGKSFLNQVTPEKVREVRNNARKRELREQNPNRDAGEQ